MIWFFLLFVVVGLLIYRRRARRSVLAGRDSARPVYSIEPPARRVGRMKDSAL